MPATTRYNGTGGPGNFLEDLIGLRAGNQDIADIVGYEVKFYTRRTNYVTLFHKEPDSAGAIRAMVTNYGWLDRLGRLSFRHTIAGRSDRFIVLDEGGSIVVRPRRGDGPTVRWTHDTLLNIAGGKLRRLLLILGERDGRRVRFMYTDAFENLHLTLLIAEVVAGTIAVDFDARDSSPGSTALRNHGTKFRVPPDLVCRLYVKKERLA